MATSNYGAIYARKRRQRNLDRDNSQSKPTSIKSKSKKIPTIKTNVMDHNFTIDQNINFEDEQFKAVVDRLVDRSITSDYNLQTLVMPTGFGKTATTVAALGELQKKAGHLLPFAIVAPTNVVKDKGWERTIATYNFRYPDNQLMPYTIDTIDRFSNILSNPKSKNTVYKNLIKGYLVIDEIHKYKNPTSKRSKQLQKISLGVKKIGLSATPFGNDMVLDNASYLIIAGKYRNKTDFVTQADLAKFTDQYGQWMIYNDDGTVNTSIWPYYSKYKQYIKDIIFQPDVDVKSITMPNVTMKLKNVESSDTFEADIKSLYRAYQKRLLESPMDLRLGLITRINTDENRLKMLLDLVKNQKNKQPLIFFSHTDVRKAIEKLFDDNDIKYQEIYGGHSSSEVDRTSDVPILCQYQSTAEGIEFKNSNCSIFYEQQPSYITLAQSQGRNVRRGTTEPVDHIYLLSNDEFEHQLFDKVQNHEELNSLMLDSLVEEIACENK